MKQKLFTCILSVSALSISLQDAFATQVESLKSALKSLLKTDKVFQKKIDFEKEKSTVIYSKGSDGKADQVVVMGNGRYPPNCDHTWTIGLNAKDATVTEAKLIEYTCHHAEPTTQKSFMDQYKGKGPKDVATLASKITPVAKATGTSELATKAIVRAIKLVQAQKGGI